MELTKESQLIDSRSAPPDILARLREIDSRAELLYAGDGVWILGVINPNDRVAKGAFRALERELRKPILKQQPRRIAVLRHVAENGFRLINDYVVDEKGDWAKVVEDFRERDFNWRNRAEAAFAENLERADIHGESYHQRVAMMHDYAQSEGRSIWRHAIAGAKSVLQRVSFPGRN